ncbi:hypothetical protein [Myroides odoratimimus]|uniref:hypothetical protein n=1 Tax=Myroides odoratimimus TaxID=76832 RepID=UPI002577942E|nr:hypothetical protein [Myroides odoratimimus]MDM1521517.1 hypothetical protein [Myroides odoratimimus]
MEEILESKIKALNITLTNYLISGPKSVREFKIDCTKLDERFFVEDIRDSLEFKELFQQLKKIENNPCLYVFTVENEISTNQLIESLKNFRDQTEKVTPSLKNKIPQNSKTLYVGKSNRLVWGRLITHLGFHTYKNNGDPKASINHGLQLYFWAKELLLQITYTVIEFDHSMKDILPLLEKQLAAELNPIIGKHK